VRSNPASGMDVLGAFFCVCAQVEALRRVDHPSKVPTVRDLVFETKRKFSRRQPRSKLGCRAKEKSTEYVADHSGRMV
jgi:hypothetical protein